jgi:haloalkane dehalogenase
MDEGEGTGNPVIFLHGNPTWSFMYRKLVTRLNEHGRCIAPDHLGCGLSDKPDSKDFNYDLNSHSRNILDLINHLKIDRFSLVVHDWGGAIGLSAFRNQTERIEKLVIMNTAAFPSRDVPKRILLCRFPILGSFLVRGLNGFAGPATFMAVRKPLNSDIKKGFLHPYNNWRNRIAVWKFVKDIPFEKNHHSLSLLKETETSLKKYEKTPILACWGMKDFCFHGGFLDEWIKKLPHIKPHRFEEAGHYLLEDKFEDCRSKIEPFLFG